MAKKKTASKKKAAGKTMTAEHKAALARGRGQGRAVRDYLAALNEDRRSGRKFNPETLQNRSP